MRRAPASFRHALRTRQFSTHKIAQEAGGPSVKITTLPNKIRVATEDTPGHFSALGLYIDTGSRYETPEYRGVSHFLDRMAFKSTKTRSDAEMALSMDKLGGQIMCSSSRESIMYQSSHFHSSTPLAMSLIADTVRNPALLPEELDTQRDAARYEIREVYTKPEMILPEVLHEVAYNGSGLGNPLLCPQERIEKIDENTIRAFMQEWYRPERMVIAGAGMPHEELVELVDKHFSSVPYVPVSAPAPAPDWQPQHSSTPRSIPAHLLPPSQPNTMYKTFARAASSYLYPSSLSSPDATTPFSPLNLKSTYTGGHRFLVNSTSEFDHLYLAFEGVGIHDDDVYALATMQVLLGGGGSFSAGGPGKGMYSRLYTHILNLYPQVDHCASFHHIYTDSSLFGLFASFVPDMDPDQGSAASQTLPHLVHQLSLLLYSPIPASELQRAKNQLKSSLVMALESRSVEVEDLGRQILVHNRKIPVSDMCEKIDEVDQATIRRVAQRVFGPESGHRATVIVNGRKDVDDWQAQLRKYGVGGAL